MAEQETPTSPLPEDVLALVPMRKVVLFPHVLAPVAVGRARPLAAMRHAIEHKAQVGIVLQKAAQVDDPGLDVLCAVGTLATPVNVVTTADGQIHAVCQGARRFRLREEVSRPRSWPHASNASTSPHCRRPRPRP